MKFVRSYSLALAGALMLGACSSSDDLKDGGLMLTTRLISPLELTM